MAFTPEQRAKALESRRANKEKRQAAAKAAAKLPDAHVEIAETTGVPNERERKLLEEINTLRAELGVANTKRTQAEKEAIAAVQSQDVGFGEVEERPTGKTAKVKRLAHYKEVGFKDDGRPILKPVFKEVELPTYAYRINMPPVGGTDLKINNVPFYHGAVYTVDIDTLRTLKSIVWNLWHHDRQIHGTDENAYRKPTNRVFSMRG